VAFIIAINVNDVTCASAGVFETANVQYCFSILRPIAQVLHTCRK